MKLFFNADFENWPHNPSICLSRDTHVVCWCILHGLCLDHALAHCLEKAETKNQEKVINIIEIQIYLQIFYKDE